MSYVIDNFTYKELRCKCGKCNVGTERHHYDTGFLAKLDSFRKALGTPIYPTSCARCQEHNSSKEVGGSPISEHLYLHNSHYFTVKAIDIPWVGNDPMYLYKVLKINICQGLFQRILINPYRHFIHLGCDTIRHTGEIVWIYPREVGGQENV